MRKIIYLTDMIYQKMNESKGFLSEKMIQDFPLRGKHFI